MKEKDTGFTTEGFKDYPNLYLDGQRIHDVMDWSDEYLVDKLKQYGAFLGDPTILPGHRVQAERLHAHMTEEWCWRDGNYTALTMKDFDELCEGA